MIVEQRVDIAVIGAGPAGLAAALALARSGLTAAIVAPPYDPVRAASDRRTTALFGPSVDFLANIGVLSRCAHIQNILAVRIADDRGALFRSPEVLFRASELGLTSFGANIPNPVLVAAFEGVAHEERRLTRITTTAVTHVDSRASDVRLRLAEGPVVTARLVVAADGRNSIGPAAASISLKAWSYPQSALATSFSHSRPHGGTVNELHRRPGPLTTVPLQGNRSSLVWVEETEEAQRIAALSDTEFGDLLEDRLQGVLGTVSDAGPRSIYPLSGSTAARMGAKRIALVGEAAHVIPPIGAQGLNLGLRDAAALADCVAEAAQAGEDIGGASVLTAYHQARAADVTTRAAGVDLLNRSLLAEFFPLDLARGAAAHLLARSAITRGVLMRAGLGAMAPLPRLMRVDAGEAHP